MVTKPDERQDKWREALNNYCALADEVIVIDGSPVNNLCHFDNSKVRFINSYWPEDWRWEILPEKLNLAKSYCTGDWILKLDIDQIIHEKEFSKLRKVIEKVPDTIECLSLMKLNFVTNMKYFAKNTQPILFRNKPDIGFGFAIDNPKGDCCIPIRLNGELLESGMPIGEMLPSDNTDCFYWNFSYTFKTKEVAKAHYLRMARAWRGYYKNNAIGANDDEAWEQFMDMTASKYIKCKDTAKLEEIPESIREAIKNLKPEEKGYDFWGEIKYLKP